MYKKDIKISVIVPVYNAEEYIGQCIESAINQKIEKEIICIDDGSTDNSIDILNEYASRFREIKVLHSDHRGTGEARNLGIIIARGEFIAFIDADDYYPSEQVLLKMYSIAKEYGVKIVGGNIIDIDINGNWKWHGDHFEQSGICDYMLYQSIYGHTRYIYNTQLFNNNKNMYPPYIRFEDPPFFMNVMVQNPIFYAYKENVYCHRINHKKVEYNRDMSLGLVCGIRDAFSIAYKNDLRIAYDKQLKHLLKGHLNEFYKYLYGLNDDFWEAIDGICEIENRWIGKAQWEYSQDQFIERVDEYRLLEKNLCKLVQNNIPVIIYGAGYYGKMIHDLFFCDYKNFIGYAVTDASNTKKIVSDSSIRCISDYMDFTESAEVIIGIKSKIDQDEITQTLNELEFENVIQIDEELFFLMGI